MVLWRQKINFTYQRFSCWLYFVLWITMSPVTLYAPVNSNVILLFIIRKTRYLHDVFRYFRICVSFIQNLYSETKGEMLFSSTKISEITTDISILLLTYIGPIKNYFIQCSRYNPNLFHNIPTVRKQILSKNSIANILLLMCLILNNVKEKLIFIVVSCKLFQLLLYCSNSCTPLHFKILNVHTKTFKFAHQMFRFSLKPSSGCPWPY
jgi:hypothetical protein